MKNNSWVFIVVPAIFIIFGIFSNNSFFEFKKNASPAEAVIVDIDRNGDSPKVYIEYSVSGEMYRRGLDFYSFNLKTGDKVKIYYSPENPGEMRSVGGNWFGWMLVAVGLFVLTVSFAPAIVKFRRDIIKKELMKNGVAVEGKIEKVLEADFSRNGTSPYSVHCRFTNPFTGETSLVKSEYIWFNPEPIMKMEKITSLPVYVDPKDPKRYCVVVDKIIGSVEDLK